MQEVILSVTNRCNLKCAMCDIPLNKEKEVSTEALFRVLDDLKILKPYSVVISGGEPMLRSDIYKLIYKAHENGFRTCLTTNGMLIDRAAALKLKKAGLDIANISIEGDEATHDAIRGKGSYKKACEALKVLWEVQIETTVAMCVSVKNYKFMPEMLRLASSCGATTVKYQAFSTLFVADKTGKGFLIDSKDDAKELKKIVRNVIAEAGKLGLNINPESYLNKLGFFLSPEALSEDVKYGCRSLYDVCSVNAKGDLVPCFMLQDMAVGNLENETLRRLWNGEKHKQIRASIESRGCRGCLLSCYEDDFKPFSLKAFIKKIIFRFFRSLDKSHNRHAAKYKELAFCKKQIESRLKTED